MVNDLIPGDGDVIEGVASVNVLLLNLDLDQQAPARRK
jgi:hypothetical protein